MTDNELKPHPSYIELDSNPRTKRYMPLDLDSDEITELLKHAPIYVNINNHPIEGFNICKAICNPTGRPIRVSGAHNGGDEQAGALSRIVAPYDPDDPDASTIGRRRLMRDVDFFSEYNHAGMPS